MTIPVLTLREALSYNQMTGLFTWRERPIWHFSNDAKWSAQQNQAKWNTMYANTPALRQENENGYLYGTVDCSHILAHRAAWAIVSGRHPVEHIDHRDGIRTNNAFENLREASRSQNNKNKAAHGTSTFLGVSFRRDRKKWRAVIFAEGKQIFLGSFDDEETAARAYDAAAMQHHGDFARLNFPHG